MNQKVSPTGISTQVYDKSVIRIVLMIVMGTSFLTPFTANAINLGIPAIGQEFSANPVLLNWVVTSNLLASAAFLLPFGRLADITGRKRIFIIGMIFLSISSLLCSLALSVEYLIFFRILQGIASSMVFGTAMAMLTSVVPPQERGKAMGLSAACTYSGLSLGPILGGLIVASWSWRILFVFNFVASAVIIITSLLKLKGEWAGARGENFDLIGSVLCSTSIVAILFGLSSITTSLYSKVIFVLGMILFIFFVHYERKQKFPLIPIDIFTKNIVFGFSNLAALINYSATFGLMYLLSLYLQTVLGYNPQTAGFIMLSQPVLMAILSPFAGKLSDRIQPRIVSSLGMGISGVGLFFFIFLGRQTPVGLIILNLALIGVGFALFASPNTNSVMSSVEKKLYGVASSSLGTMRLVGQAMSMAIVTMTSSLYVGGLKIGSVEYADHFLKSLEVSFIIFAILSVFAVFASLARGRAKIGQH
ncbi:MAG: MFS transporter [Desulfitobacterium hafniense]|nr:MFS transporter [Desulfitobacterium hafniense]